MKGQEAKVDDLENDYVFLRGKRRGGRYRDKLEVSRGWMKMLKVG